MNLLNYEERRDMKQTTKFKKTNTIWNDSKLNQTRNVGCINAIMKTMYKSYFV